MHLRITNISTQALDAYRFSFGSAIQELSSEDPDEYYMRPRLFADKFPDARNVSIPADVEARVRAQNEAGHLIFGSGVAATNTAGK